MYRISISLFRLEYKGYMIEMNKTNDKHAVVTVTVKLEFQRETIKYKVKKADIPAVIFSKVVPFPYISLG